MRKCSRRDLPLAMALGLDGATTVSATMLLAARAGIHVFVTGGAPRPRCASSCSCHLCILPGCSCELNGELLGDVAGSGDANTAGY